jgi:hypothetical protein
MVRLRAQGPDDFARGDVQRYVQAETPERSQSRMAL